MFNSKPTKNTELLDDNIEVLLTNMLDVETEASPEYAAMVDQLVKLHALKLNESSKRVSPDTLATIVANLSGILIVVGYEQKHIITTKALAFLRKLG